MVRFCVAAILLSFAVSFVDLYLLGNSFYDSMTVSRAAFYVPVFIVLFYGAFLAERATKAERSGEPDADDNDA